MKQSFFQKVFNLCKIREYSFQKETLEKYSKDFSFFIGEVPKCIAWVTQNNQIEMLLKLANKYKFKIIPVSSKSIYRMHGDTIPRKKDSIILNLSKMDKILEIDRKNKAVKIQPGVTYQKLLKKLEHRDLKLLSPLHPRAQKSVLMGALDREPITIPRYHWDSSDPLLCTELFFGSGHFFRTGSAAGPGTIEQQQKMGQAQINPMGPTQFSPYRIIQGSQGSIGVVLWGTLKIELKPDIQEVYHLQSNNLAELLELQYYLIRNRLCDELLILNNINLACLLQEESEKILSVKDSLMEWNLIYVISGYGELAKERIKYLKGDIAEIIEDLQLNKDIVKDLNRKEKILHFLTTSTQNPWRFRLKGAVQDIQFLINYQKIDDSISLVMENIQNEVGVYIQPINQGTSYYCELDVFYNPQKDDKKKIKKIYYNVTEKLIHNGCFFNRPYDILSNLIYKNQDAITVDVLRKVKHIFDPNNILNPGVLCFDEQSNSEDKMTKKGVKN